MNYDKLISDRLGGKDFFKTSYYKFEKFNKLKKQYILENENELLDFGIGESDFMPYHEILDEFSKQIYVNGNQKYSDNGIEIFKDAARQHLKETYKLKTNDLEINHVIGAKSALCIIPIAFISENDYVITTTPGYQVLSNMSKWLKAKIYEIPLLEENNYLPDLDKIDENIYKKTKLFVINYPNSPTGAIANKKFYAKLISKALKYNFLIVNDCVYGPLTYKNNPLSIMSIKNANKCAIEIHSLSKAFNMTGFRIGFVIANKQLIHIIKEVKDNMDSGQYIPIQYAAIKAFKTQKKSLESLKDIYYTRLKNVARILNKYNLKCTIPDATFYLYVKVPLEFNSAEDFSIFLLEKCGIFTIPWDEADPHIRFSMTFKTDNDDMFYDLLDKRLSLLSEK